MAACRGGGVGLRGGLPWKVPREFKFFVEKTKQVSQKGKQNVLIMGRGSWEEINEPMPGRQCVIVSQTMSHEVMNAKYPSVHVQPDFRSALDYIDNNLKDIKDSIYFIGGAKLFGEAAKNPRCRLFYYSQLGLDFECDRFLPKGYLDGFTHLDTSKTYSQNDVPFVFSQYLSKNYQGSYHQTRKNLYDERHEEFQYLELIEEIMRKGVKKGDRTGTGTLGVFGRFMKFDLSESFPLLTTKRVFFKGVLEELLWFLEGNTNGNVLRERGVGIWDGNGSREYLDRLGFPEREVGDLGPIYGFQWRHFGAKYIDMHTDYKNKGVDQLKALIETIKSDPNSRRLIMNAWNAADLKLMALPPCHVLSQFYVSEGKLDCLMYQRSCDMGLGVPFNIASYSLLTCMIAQVCGLKPGQFTHVLGDCHVYLNHVEALQKQIKRIPSPFPILKLNPDIKDIEKFRSEDFKLIGYHPQPTIKMEMAV